MSHPFVIARSEATRQSMVPQEINLVFCDTMDCFAALAMTRMDEV